MNFKAVFIAVAALLVTQNDFALGKTCEEWKQALPANYAKDLKLASEPDATQETMIRSCANQVGTYALSYVKNRGKNAVILELAARVGISGGTASFVMVTGHQVLLAWNAAKFVYAAFEADKACFENFEQKRGMLEPISHFYPESVIENWVRNLGCTEIGHQVHNKVQALDATLAEKARKQKEWEQIVSPERRLSPEQLRRLERMHPAEGRELTANEKIYADKRARMARPLPLLDVAVDLMPCLKPEALARMACGFVAEAGVNYMGKNYDVRNVGLKPDLKTVLQKVAEQLPAAGPRR